MTRTSTFCYTWDGEFVWVSNTAIEPQSLNLGEFRTDAQGLTVWGLDRRTRGAASNSGWGRDSLFMIGTNGEGLFLEYGWNSGNPMGWSTIVIRVDNWTGTYAPMCLAFNRNSESRAGARDFSYPAGAGNSGAANRPVRKALWMNDYREPALYDGYANPLFKLSVPMSDRDYMFENNVDWRFMAMDLCGDARTELVGYDDSGRIRIYYNNANGDVGINEDGTLNEEDRLATLRSGITGEPKPQTYFMSNYTRYPTDVYFDNIEKRIPAQAQAVAITGDSAFITWTPVITATSYSLFRDGVEIASGLTTIGFLDEDVFPGGEFSYTVVAFDGERFSPPSLPLVIEVPEPISAGNAKFAGIIEMVKNSKVLTLTFEVTFVYEDGSTITKTISINLSGNNLNIDGKYVFPANHLLAGYTLTYDIKGNGSNIKVFNLK